MFGRTQNLGGSHGSAAAPPTVGPVGEIADGQIDVPIRVLREAGREGGSERDVWVTLGKRLNAVFFASASTWNINLSDIREKVLGAPPQTIRSDVSALTSQSSGHSIGTI